ncbi:siderophore ABC transporter substrate-binding protein [Paracoccus sp. 1_MG-2023]|uniref:siderophore ABC transporter substrate-binding protein n=1 Tax=unclassified Paracoccus (in: a-proteobacteria) TaxID=2688777 RepID=UPI001C0A3954|nr:MULTISPECIES: siderophore ABC transporter substrate-binding protein [unclassified Paracoccus (in: a-proteobacteria)]MBU2956232.1 siderophore ABC transporter substrate-binding protein [Paracoccus sp. C2R09]MDO6667909.1 siderophore ABC transporter substrate-binding protein [Paracoccus sp. 1_MG-2023]
MRHVALSGLMAIAMSTAALAQDVTIATAQGDVTLPANPETVAVYDMGALDSLTALGVVPAATIDNILVPELREAVGDAAQVGTLFEPDLEALAGVGPDLTIVGGRSSTQLAAVSQVGTAIDMTFGDDLLASARERIAAYGTLFGHEDRAAEMIATIDARLEATRAASEGKGDMLVVMTNGPKIAAYGADSRFGWLHDATGLPEAVEGVDRADHGQGISHEFIAEADPDWLIVIDRSAAIGEESQGAEQTLSSDLVAGTKAWSKGQVIYLDPAETYISAGGFRALTDTLDQLTEAFAAAH